MEKREKFREIFGSFGEGSAKVFAEANNKVGLAPPAFYLNCFELLKSHLFMHS